MKQVSLSVQLVARLIIVMSVLSIFAFAHSHNSNSLDKNKDKDSANKESIIYANASVDNSADTDLTAPLKKSPVIFTSALLKPFVTLLLFDGEYGHCYSCTHGHSYCIPSEAGKNDCLFVHEGPNCVGDSNGG